MTKPSKHVETMGERLRRQALQLAARHRLPMPWRPMVTATLQRDAAHSQLVRERWRRIEARLPSDTAPRTTPPATAGGPLPPEKPGTVPGPPARHVDGMRLHEGPSADAVARDRRADAVTIGRDVFLRTTPTSPPNDRLPLLAHEATHVRSFQEPHVAWHRSTSVGIRAEEARALESEHVAGRSPLLPAARPGPSSAPAAPAPVGASASSPSLKPMAAQSARHTIPALGTTTSDPAGVDVRAIREGLMRDLIDSVRTDAERGG